MIVVAYRNDGQDIVVVDKGVEYFDEHRFVVGETE